jgi:hypothetical protein
VPWWCAYKQTNLRRDRCLTAMEKLRIVTLGVRFRVGDRSRGRYATPLDFPLNDGTPYRGLRVRRWGLGFCPSFKDHSLSRRAKP